MISLLGDTVLPALREDMRLALATERRSESIEGVPLSQATFLLELFGGLLTESGERVNERTAFEVADFLSSVDLIAGKIAALPFHLKERTFLKSGRAVNRIAYEHPSYALANSDPNDEMTAHGFMKAFLIHALAWHSGFAEIQWAASGFPVGIWPRNPDRTFLRRLTHTTVLAPEPWRPWTDTLPAGSLVCETTDGQGASDNAEDGQRRILPMYSVLSLPGISFDGRVGESVVRLARRVLGMALATEKFGARYFANFARPGGILELPALTPEQRAATKQSYLDSQSGENSHRVFVAPIGTKWTSTSHSPEDAQALETRAHIRATIASLFHLAPRYIGDTSKNSRATVEQDSLELLSNTLTPWMVAICQEFRRKFFPSKVTPLGRIASPFFYEFDTWGLIRPDAASRNAYYAGGRQWSYLNPNEVREREGENPIDEPWAEEYHLPVNMTRTTTPIDPNRAAANGMDPNAPSSSPAPPPASPAGEDDPEDDTN